jgi:hypothetical protein
MNQYLLGSMSIDITFDAPLKRVEHHEKTTIATTLEQVLWQFSATVRCTG